MVPGQLKNINIYNSTARYAQDAKHAKKDIVTAMAQVAIDQYLKLIPAVRFTPQRYLWSSYDAEADVL